MNRITMTGYLKYFFLKEVKTGTLAIRKLVSLAGSNEALFEYTALYAVLTGKEHLCADDAEMMEECNRIKEADEIALLSPGYRSLYDDFEAFSKGKYNDEFKKSLRNRIIEAQRDKNISNYRIYTDLSLNPGNVNSFLKNGEYRKLSIDVIRRIWKYVERM